ncbi:MAG: integration host factor subunit alpha [Lactobacillaceae bacterium]|jgi:integration host factor subunit alpha|nr:integration host factor subunit alpha [Lactobacillaceae bacterium]
MKTITRADVTDEVCKEVGLSRKDASDIFDTVIDEVIQELVSGNEVKLSSFGTFSLRDKKQRVGRNPKTGIEAVISSRRVISFKPSQTMRKIINA